MAINWNAPINKLIRNLNRAIVNYSYTLLIALITILSPTNTYASTADGDAAKSLATMEPSSTSEIVDKEKRRELMEKAIREEKLKMRTSASDSANKRRSAGEILGFDVFLGGFLTALWGTISLFFATRFFPSGKDAAKNDGNSGPKVFYAIAALMPLMLLWVAISTGYASWWLTFAVSVSIYWLLSKLLIRIRSAIAKQIRTA